MNSQGHSSKGSSKGGSRGVRNPDSSKGNGISIAGFLMMTQDKVHQSFGQNPEMKWQSMYVLWKLRRQPQFYPLGPSILYFEADSLTALEITNWARLTGQWAQDCSCLWLPSAGIPSKLPPCLSVSHGSQGLNSASHACMQALNQLSHFSISLLLSLTPISHLH